jgi:hypothetical protein
VYDSFVGYIFEEVGADFHCGFSIRITRSSTSWA